MRISDWSSDVCSSDLVGLQGYLGAGGKAPERSDLLQRGGHRFGRHQRRRAATEEDGADPAGAALCGGVLQVAQQRRPPARLVDALAHVAVDVAVVALRSTERPVPIDTEARAVLWQHLGYCGLRFGLGGPRLMPSPAGPPPGMRRPSA